MSDDDSDNDFHEVEMEYEEPPRPEREPSCGMGLPIKILTENDIIGYIQERFRQAEKNAIHWLPLMRLISKRTPDMPELMIGTVELFLNVPVQLTIVFENYRLRIDECIIPYDGRLFIDARRYVQTLLSEGFISIDEIREQAKQFVIHNHDIRK